jgi:hypothetical protein
VIVASPSNSIELQVKPAVGSANFVLKPNEIKKLSCAFDAKLEDVGKDIQLSSIHIFMGVRFEESVLLRYSTLNNAPSAPTHKELLHFG